MEPKVEFRSLSCYCWLAGWGSAEVVKFIYFEKATNFCKISTVDLSYAVMVKSTEEISQNFVAF